MGCNHNLSVTIIYGSMARSTSKNIEIHLIGWMRFTQKKQPNYTYLYKSLGFKTHPVKSTHRDGYGIQKKRDDDECVLYLCECC